MDAWILVAALIVAILFLALVATKLSYGSFRNFWEQKAAPVVAYFGGGRAVAAFFARCLAATCAVMLVIVIIVTLVS